MKRILSLLLILALLMPATTAFAQEPVTELLRPEVQDVTTKLAEEVLAMDETDGLHEFLVEFNSTQDVIPTQPSPRLMNQGYTEQQALQVGFVHELKNQAEQVQQPFVRYLDQANIEYETFFVANMMWLKTDYETMLTLADSPAVKHVYSNKKVHLSPMSPASDTGADGTIEWNVKQIGADQVWRQGIDGEGVTVGIIDSGGEWTHPALKEKWLAFDPNNPTVPKEGVLKYSWFDPISNSKYPIDDNDHATHCLGTILGQEPNGANTIGVAPGAKWIAARAFGADGSASGRAILQSAEWMLAPGGDASKAPQVINNSWGGGDGIDDWFREVVRSWRKANIVPVFAAGNQGLFEPAPWPGSIENPGNYPESFAVAATDRDNKRGSFSKLGPSPYDEKLWKPEISAPGVDIRSSVTGGRYGSMDGTSMAAPHITGVIALMLSSNSGLTAEELQSTIEDTATPLTDATYPNSPNMGYGYGLVNAKEAVEYVASGLGLVTGTVLIEGNDLSAPTLSVTPGPELAFMDRDFYVTAEAGDDISIAKVELLYKWEEDADFNVVELRLKEGEVTDGSYSGYIPKAPFFGADIPGEQALKEGTMTYSVKATDFSGKTIESEKFTAKVLFGMKRDDFREDMQSDLYGWELLGDWNQGIPSAYGEPEPFVGEKLVGTLVGEADYNTITTSYLVTPPLDLRDASIEEATLKFRHWYKMAVGSTIGQIRITDNNGLDWYELTEEYYSGDSEGWVPDSVSLNEFIGSKDPVYLAFIMTSGYWGEGPGWYINQVELEGEDVTAPVPPTELSAEKTFQGIQLRWKPSLDGDIKTYQVFRQATGETEFTMIGETKKLEYLDIETTPGTEYIYKVRASDYSENVGEFGEPITVTALVYTELLFDDFEQSDGNYTTQTIPSSNPDLESTNIWQWGDLVYGPDFARSGSKLWATNLSGDYTNNHNARLITPPVELPATTDKLAFNFQHWYDGEKYWSLDRASDYGFLEISTDGGQTFEAIAGTKWAGHIREWTNETFDLSAYQGQTVQLAFRFISDKWSFGSETFIGWYIDDVGFYQVADADFVIPASQDIPFERNLFEGEDIAVASELNDISALHTPQSGETVVAEKELIPVDEAEVTIVETGYGSPVNRADGSYRLRHPVASDGSANTLRASAYGYYPETRPITFVEGEEIVEHFILNKIPRTTITGTIRDEISGEPIEGARVRLLEDSRIRPVLSDAEGNFRMDEVFAGDYTLHVYHPNYNIATENVTAEMDSLNPVEIVLQPFVPYEEELGYDDGMGEDAVSLRRPGVGYGTVFQPESFAHVKAVRAFFWGEDFPNPGGNEISLVLMKANQDMVPLNEPLFEPIPVTVTRGAWNTFDISELNIHTDEPFIATFIQTKNGDYSPAIGIDNQAVKNNKHSYIFLGENFKSIRQEGITGSWMIRAVVDYSMATPMIEQVTPTNLVDDIYYTNQTSVQLSGPIDGAGKVEVFLNGELYDTVTTSGERYQATARVAEGANLFKVRGRVDAQKTGFSPEITVIRDRVAPIITVTEPSSKTVGTKVIDIVGQVTESHPESFTIEGKAVTTDDEGNFKHSLILKEGVNNLTLVAKDKAGNETRQPLQLIYEPGAGTGTWEITQAWPAADQVLYAGDEITLRVESNLTGANAYYALKLPQMQAVTTPNMTQVTPGVYEAKWTVPADLKIDQVKVEYTLEKDGVRLVAESEGNLSVRLGGVHRIFGKNRYETAAKVSSNHYMQSEVAVIVSGENFPEALAAGIYANHKQGPLLMTNQKSISQFTLSELDRLGVKQVELIGGVGAISADVEKTLVDLGYTVNRIEGKNRYETNVNLSKASHDKAETVFLVSGEGYADGLSVAPIAYQEGAPLLLSAAKTLPQVTLQAIKDYGATEVVIVGGTGAISQAIEDQLKADFSVKRIGGQNRYETNINLCQAYASADVRGIIVASGNDFADALAGGSMAAKLNQPLILAGTDQFRQVSTDYLAELTLEEITLLGGPTILSKVLEASCVKLIN